MADYDQDGSYIKGMKYMDVYVHIYACIYIYIIFLYTCVYVYIYVNVWLFDDNGRSGSRWQSYQRYMLEYVCEFV
jgi:hypothetical protein